MAFGVYAHYQSHWSSMKVEGQTYKTYAIVCKYVEDNNLDEKCPKIWMERLFVAVTIVFFVLSVLLQIALFFEWSDRTYFEIGVGKMMVLSNLQK